jgi:hypothetical protein
MTLSILLGYAASQELARVDRVYFRLEANLIAKRRVYPLIPPAAPLREALLWGSGRARREVSAVFACNGGMLREGRGDGPARQGCPRTEMLPIGQQRVPALICLSQ